MSSQKGNAIRSRPQKYQNNSVFKKDLYGTTPQTKALDSMKVEGLCSKCTSVIQWKIKFLKYKKLTVPSKCVKCLDRTVKEAYHTMCRNCASAAGKCPKCCEDHGKIAEEDKTAATTENQVEVEHGENKDRRNPATSARNAATSLRKTSLATKRSRDCSPELPSGDSSVGESE
ncbi:hypothetical protein RvY_02308-1 [Ramazzottius varieornatus]|uniref:Uncharacterized protein n=1 Tax=Ramazzottius varieornatus TaxID=947166 RepID=A0A1D1UUE5_RAMVA|nr:hypothetical protein RvY_02308-1 [Ramazzottius varieornatus]